MKRSCERVGVVYSSLVAYTWLTPVPDDQCLIRDNKMGGHFLK